MPEINQLSSVYVVASSDQVPIYQSSTGTAVKASLSVIKEFINPNTSYPVTQYAYPSSNGSIQVNDNGQNVWLIINPQALTVDIEVVMPMINNIVDNQELLIKNGNVGNNVVITFDRNGSDIIPIPDDNFSAGSSISMKYNLQTEAWYVTDYYNPT
jgi:hypothetical protein